MSALVLAEYDSKGLKKSTRAAVTAARQVSEKITVLVVGSDAAPAAAEAAKLTGVEKIWVNKAAVYDFGKAETIATLIAELGNSFSYIFAAATSYGKNILPRVAALLDVAQISDITQIVPPDTFKRPIYAGNVIAVVQAHDPIKVITVRYTAFADTPSQTNAAPIEELTQIFDYPRTQYISQNLNISDRPELTSARVIVSGGRALGSKEKFKNLLEPLAVKLHAAIGASRAAVDAGYADNDYQVGQTGKIVAPELYIAVGISGAIQHLAGMKESKIIVAINKDDSCEMMKVADYRLNADIFTVLPELIEKL